MDTTTDTQAPTLEQRIDTLQNAVKTLTQVFRKQEIEIRELRAMKDKPARKPRNITAAPEAIAFAAYLRDKENFSVRQLEESGVLTYSKSYGLYSWDEEFLQDFLEKHDVQELYEEGKAHPEFADYVPNYIDPAKDE